MNEQQNPDPKKDYNEGNLQGDISDFFSDYASGSSDLTKRLYIISGILTLFIVPDLVAPLIFPKIEILNSIFDPIWAAGVSLGCGLIAVRTVNITNQRRLNTVRRLADNRLLHSLFQMIDSFQQRHIENQTTEVKFTKIREVKHPEKNIIQKYMIAEISISYQVHIKPSTQELHFGLLRMDGNSDKHIDNEKYEYIWTHDERTLSKFFVAEQLDNLYSDFRVFVDGLEYKSNTREARTIFGTSKEDKLENISVNVLKINDDKLHNIIIKISLPFEVPGYKFFTVPLPAKGFVCEINYTDLANEINVYVDDLLSSRSYKRLLHLPSNGKVTVSHDDWVLPKSSIFFTWYSRNHMLEEAILPGKDSKELQID